MINCTINGKAISIEENTTILEAARQNGIDIPTLCYLKGVNEIGSCRLCMVEVQGFDHLIAACKTKVQEGFVITTESEKLTNYRITMLKLILSNHVIDCMNCPENGICRLQALCNKYGIEKSEFTGSRSKLAAKFPKLES